jgi:hypothetical protein
MHMFPSASYQVVFKFKTGGILLDPLTGLGRFLTLKPAPLGLGSLMDTRPVRRLDLSSLAHLGLKAEHRCFQSRLDITSPTTPQAFNRKLQALPQQDQ